MNYTVSAGLDEWMLFASKALATALYAAPSDYDEDNETIMFYQGKGDAGTLHMSVFAKDVSCCVASHGRMSLSNMGCDAGMLPTVPVDKYASDNRAFMTVGDLGKFVKWLKPLPKGYVSLRWEDDPNGVKFFAIFRPNNSQKNFPVLNFSYPASAMWNTRFRVPFNQGRFAYVNAINGKAVRQFNMLTMRPRIFEWANAMFGGHAVDMVPFDNGSMLYLRSDRFTKLEGACVMAVPARTNRRSVANDEDSEA